MRTLVFGDVHNLTHRVRWLLDNVEYDQAICTGDWFDDWHDGPAESRKTGTFLKEYLSDARHRSVMGNHDLPYFWPAIRELRRWGASRNKVDTVTRILKPISLYRQKLPYYLWVDGWLVSHAGVSIHLIPDHVRSDMTALFEGWLEDTTKNAVSLFFGGVVDPWFDAGTDRGGIQRHGGILWQDWDSLEPIPGLNQVVGHTRNPALVRSKNVEGSENWCIDTGLRHYALIEDGEIAVHDIPNTLT